MSVSNSRQSYRDCYEIWDQALADPAGIRIRMNTEDAATYFRMRLHQARKINRDDNATTYEEGHPMHGASSYDVLVARIRRRADGYWIYLEHNKIDKLAIQSLGEIEDVEEEPEVSTPPMVPSMDMVVERIKRRV